MGVFHHRVVDDLGNEPEGALRPDHQVGHDVEGVVEVDQRVEAVAGGVLHFEFVADAVGQGRIVLHPGGQIGEGMRASPRGWRQIAPGFASSAVSRSVPSWQMMRMLLDGLVAVLGGAAAHAAGVVGRDPADHGGVDGGRVRADFAPVGRQVAGWRGRR